MNPSLVEFLKPLKKSPYPIRVMGLMFYAIEYEDAISLTSAEVRAKFTEIRDKVAASKNIPDILSRCGSSGYAETLAEKRNGKIAWKLTNSGKAQVRAALGLTLPPISAVDAEIAELTKFAQRVKNDMARDFLLEAIKCLKADALRATIVFVWSGTMRVIEENLSTKPLADVNNAVQKHNPKAREIKRVEDFAFINDDITLLVARDLGLFDKGQHTILKHGLDLRNHCGHPSLYTAGLNKTKVFIEETIQLVFEPLA